MSVRFIGLILQVVGVSSDAFAPEARDGRDQLIVDSQIAPMPGLHHLNK
jgi:hypothetical protein